MQKYRNTQPKAVAALRRNIRTTLAYFTVLDQHPTWQRNHLRTTSRLERFNRHLRRRTPALAPKRSAGASVRSANAYHSDAGVLAMIAQVVDRTIPLPSERKQHTHFQPKAIH